MKDVVSLILAHELKAPYVRVFPNALVKGEDKQVTIARIIAGLRELGDHAKGSGVSVIVESHGEFNKSPLLLEIIKGANHPNVAFLWDAHHTCVAGEKPEETYRQLKAYVRHTHLKDSRALASTNKDGEKERRYVLMGTGEVPGERDCARAGEGRLSRLLLFGMGETLASRNRRA
jgi:sugar phosphate isomerase/epimerase